MAAKLLPFGYDIFIVDIQWHEPFASTYEYSRDPVPTMDGYGHLLPAPNRFPFSAGGRWFAPLAAEVHAPGMKFGIHLMRGILPLAVKRNPPVLARCRHRRQVERLFLESGNVRRRHVQGRCAGLLRQRVRGGGDSSRWTT